MAFYYYYYDFNSTLNIVTLLQFGLDAFFFLDIEEYQWQTYRSGYALALDSFRQFWLHGSGL